MRKGLLKSGYVEGQNILFDVRSAQGRLDLLPKLAAELVALKVDVLVALYTPCARAAQQATDEIPIVAIAANPVETGLVAASARPGGNITGVSLMAAEAQANALELFARHASCGSQGSGTGQCHRSILEVVPRAGPPCWQSHGLEIAPTVMVRIPDEIDAAFEAMRKDGASAVVVQGSLSTKAVAELAVKHRLAAATFTRSFAEVGGLMSYGPDAARLVRRGVHFVIKILQGRQACRNAG